MAKSAGSHAGVEDAIDRLYEGPLDRFTADRNALAASLKKDGDADGASRVKALAKPTATAWAVNQVWWRHRDRFQTLLEAGRAQRQAHVAWADGRPSDVRAAGEARQAAVRDVTDAAVEVLGGRKVVAPDAQYRIAGTVEALASSGMPEGEVPGRLTRDLQSSGLDALGALAAAAGAVTRPTLVARGTADTKDATPRPRPAISEASALVPASGPAGETARARKAREAEEAAAHARATALAQAQARVAELDSALDRATQAADDAAANEARTRDSLDAATRRRAEIEATLDEARAEEAAARRALSAATAAASRATLDRARTARDVARAREALETLKPDE